MVIFFRDPPGKHPQEVDVNRLMRLYDVHNVILLATNYDGSYLIYEDFVDQYL